MECQTGVMVPIYKKKGDLRVHSNYWDYTSCPPQKSLLLDAGRGALTDCLILDSEGVMWLLSLSWDGRPDLHTFSIDKGVMENYVSGIHVFCGSGEFL